MKHYFLKGFLIASVLVAVRTFAQPSPGGVSVSLSSWFKANTTTNLGLNGSNVAQWTSEVGTYSATQATTSRQPDYVNTAIAANNFNFNPSVQFNAASFKSLNNTNTTPDLLGTTGTMFLIVNTNNYAANSSSCFAYYSNSSYRYQVKAHFRIQTGANGTGYTADFVPQFPTTYDDAAGRLLVGSGTGSGFYSKRNGEKFSINNTAPLYFPAVSGGLCIGSNNNGGGGEYSNSAIAELITYTTQLSDADANKVESYLALKYGITLQSPVAPVSYVNATGGTIWDATTNIGYNNNITGIGRDDGSGLLQKQSFSVNTDRLVALYNGNTNGIFPAMNTANTIGFPNDQSFFIFGDNGLGTALGACLYQGKMARMNRIWKVQQTGTGPVTLSVEAAVLAPSIKNLVVSTDPNFSPATTTIYPLQTAGAQLYRSLTLNNGEYFSFASDSLQVNFTLVQPTCTNPNGGSITATVNNGTPFTDFTWNTNPVQSGLTATGLGAGTYTFSASFGGGTCTATYNAGTIQAASGINLSVAATAPVICQGDTTRLTATASGGTGNLTYTWTPGNFTTPTIAVAPSDTTKYYVTVQSGACSRTDSIVIAVKPRPTAGFTAQPATVCLGDTNRITYTGTAGAAATYNWNGFAGATVISGTAAGPYQIRFGTAGTFIIELQVTQDGCSSEIDSQQVIVQAPPVVSFSATPASICAGDTVAVRFTGTAPATATYNWNWDGGTLVSGTGAGPLQVRYTTSGTIRLTVVSGTCTVQATPRLIQVTPLPVASFTLSDTTGCDNLLVRFTNSSQNGTSWQWDLGDGTTSTAASPAPRTYTTGVYPVSLTATNGNCTTTATIRTIRVVAGPVAAFTAVPTAGQPVQLSQAIFQFTNASTGATRYLWLFGDNNSSTTSNPLHPYNSIGTFTVSLIAYNQLGCTDTLQQSPFIVIADSLLRIPNVFSPNGDGINDTWVITGLRGYPTSRMNIYNRWGQVVFTSTGYNTPWDGSYKGSPLPAGTYYYTITANNRNYSGPITVLR